MSCCQIRYLIILTLMLLGFVAFINRSNLSIAIVSMVNRPNATAEHPDLCPAELDTHGNDSIDNSLDSLGPSDDPVFWSEEPVKKNPSDTKYDWSPEIQGIVLGAFFYTYFFLQVPAGYVVSRLGSRTPIVISCIVTGVVSIAGPFVADVSVEAFIGLRIAMGVVQAIVMPACFVIICAWVPVRERSTAMAVQMAGMSIATTTMSFASGYLVNAYTWRAMFYLPGIISAVVAVFLCLFLRNTPEEHCLVTPAELDLIRAGLGKKEMTPILDENGNPIEEVTRNEAIVKDPIPWIAILTNKSVLVVLFYRFARGCLSSLLTSEMPTYLVTVLNMDIVSMGIFGAFHSICTLVVSITGAKISEVMIERNYCSRTNARKMFSLCNGLLDAICIMLIPAFRCNLTAVLIVYTASAVMGGFSGAAEGPIVAEMTTKFHGMIFAISNMVGTLPGFIAPMVTGYVLKNVKNQWQAWDMLFYSCGALVILGNILYVIFVSAKRQSFDIPKEERLRRASRYNSVNIETPL